jgi:hypothetical protein
MELAQALLYRLLIHSSSMKTVVLLSFLFNSFIATFSAAIAKYFAASVDLKVLDQENIYSKAQAELILKDFFSKHSLKTFNIAHKSVLKNDSQFAIGTLETTNGKFRVNFVMKTAAGVSTITQFRIEHEDE